MICDMIQVLLDINVKLQIDSKFIQLAFINNRINS